MRQGAGPAVVALVSAALAVVAGDARAEGGTLPKNSYAPAQLYQIISPELGAAPHNQPSIVNGALMLAGNGRHELWNIHDPTHPVLMSKLTSPHSAGTAEAHQVSFCRRGDRHLAVTISGKGIDFWDLTDAKAPLLLGSQLLEGIDYGDNTHAVWGLSWQGRYVYVGGTNTGLHVVDAGDPEKPSLVTRVPTVAFGGVSAGPVFALGNLLVVATPKESAGVATLDIGDPSKPTTLDFEIPSGDSYIGGFYGRYLHLLTPWRTYDVTTDPSDIKLVGSVETPKSEYVSFGDGFLFLGALRPNSGIFKYDLTNPVSPKKVAKIEGRKEFGGLFTDDQFSLPVGNLLVMSDDEGKIGSVITVHDTQADSKPPEVMYVNPPDGATKQPLTSRVGISFSDQIDLRSVDATTLVVRPLGGSALTGSYGHTQTLVSFWPDAPLLPGQVYEIVLPAGGVKDLAGNPLPKSFSSLFSTGTELSAPKCSIAGTAPVPVGTPVVLSAAGAPAGATTTWQFGDGSGPSPTGTHAYSAPGRYPVTLKVETADGARSCTALQIVHRPLAPVRPTRSSTVVLDEVRRRAWLVNPDSDSISAVDIDSSTVTREIGVGRQPRTLALAPDGSVWVASQGSDEITVVDGEGPAAARIPLGWGARPFGIAFARDGQSAWVTLEGAGALAELDPVTRSVRSRIELGPGIDGSLAPRGLALFGESVWVSRFRSPEDHGLLWRLDASGAWKAVELSADPGPDETTSGRGIPNSIASLTLSPDGTRAFVPAKKDNTLRGLARDGLKLTSDNTVRTMVASVELGPGSEDAAWRVDLDNHDMASAVELSSVGDLVFVASQGTNHVDVLDAYTGKLVSGFSTGAAPQGLVLSSDGRLFVQCFMGRSLDVFDVKGLLAGTDTVATKLASIPVVTVETLSPAVLDGKRIFYNAADPRMSLDGYLSCATCHPDGGDDGRVWDFSDRGEGLRNTIPLVGRGGTGHGRVHWTANFDEIQDFENDIRLHFGGGGFMRDADYQAPGVSDPLGAPKAGLSEPLDALATYVSSLVEVPKSPFRSSDGSLTSDAVAGRALLTGSLDCLDCHSGPALTDSAKGKLHDVGTLRPTSGQRLGEPLGGIDTPTLRGLWASGPYFHDGSAATLREVIDSPLHGNASKLSDRDKDRLVAYLLQIENEEVGPPEPTLAPTGGCSVRPGAPRAPAWLLLLSAGLAAITARRRAPRFPRRSAACPRPGDGRSWSATGRWAARGSCAHRRTD